MRHSLQYKINLISILCGIVIAAGLIAAGARVISDQITENLITHSRLAAEELVGQIGKLQNLGLNFDDIIGLDEQCRAAVAKDELLAFVGIFDSKKILRFASGNTNLIWPRGETAILDKEHDEIFVRTDQHLVVIHPIHGDDTNEAYVVVATNRSLLYDKILKAVLHFAIVAAILVLIGLTIQFAFLRKMVIQPLKKLVEAVQAVNEKNFTGLTSSTNADKGEIHELATTFANLLRRLSDAQNEAARQANRAINAEKELNRTIVQSSPLAIYTRDVKGLITAWNHACEQMFGWSAAEVIGKTLPTIPEGEEEESMRLRDRVLESTEAVQIEVKRQKRDGTCIYLITNLSALRNELGGLEGYLAIAADITARKAAEQKIEFLAHHDVLTRLPNRRLVEERFNLAAEHARRQQAQVGIVFLDLDNFKAINDSFGHSVGDSYLKEIAQRLGQCVRISDTISRQGGDEFLIVLGGLSRREDIVPALEKTMQLVQQPVTVDGNELSVSMSVGISFFPKDGEKFDELLKKADMAMYRAKEEGKNTYRFFDEEMNVQEINQHSIRVGLKRALERKEFILHYQPQMDLHTGAVVGVEALIRWNHPEQGLVPPMKFIHIAEESGMIVPIGAWAIHEACRQAAKWIATGFDNFSMAVNLSSTQLKSGDLEHTVTTALEQSGLPAHHLELELTESLLIHNVDKVQAMIKRLKNLGVSIAIDDFGTGYSSLSYIKRLDVDKLKIDRSFIKDLARDQDDTAIVTAIIQMAHSLKLKTVAEGVEDADIAAKLSQLQCDEAQGFYFAKPMPPEECFNYMTEAGHTLSS